ncbi:Clp protease [compost metagenome]
MMIHKPWNYGMGNANDFRKMADDLDAIEEGMLNVYKENLNDDVEIETIKDMLNNETWLNGAEAAKYFNIEVGEENTASACVSDYYKNYSKMPSELKEKLNSKKKPQENNLEKDKLLMELDLI